MRPEIRWVQRGSRRIIGSVGSAHKRESGQAAVEAALTLPLVLFVMLGTLQLFMMFHGRIVTQLAAYRAARAGSVSHGNCNRMVSAAVLQLLPAIHPFLAANTPGGTPGGKLAYTWKQYCGGGVSPFACNDKYASAITINDGGRSVPATGAVVWVLRRIAGRQNIVGSGGQDTEFDQAPSGGPGGSSSMRMETELIFWFPMKIPFANWVMAKMVESYWSIQTYGAQNPLMMTQTANWSDATQPPGLPGAVLGEMQSRMARGEYVFPITATFGMRMMTPLKRANYNPGAPNCAPAPGNI